MRAERVGAETMLSQIVRRVGEAQRSRAPIQRLADRVSAWFVPAVIFIGWHHIRCLGLHRSRTADGACSRQRSCRADHCLSLRAGSGHAHVHHGRYRAEAPHPAC